MNSYSKERLQPQQVPLLRCVWSHSLGLAGWSPHTSKAFWETSLTKVPFPRVPSFCNPITSRPLVHFLCPSRPHHPLLCKHLDCILL
uniref:Uncharacterized protein n=1 Tax=Anguilla anguilla TaxID=7936 RepID=A0A0E9WSF9_ANGAN